MIDSDLVIELRRGNTGVFKHCYDYLDMVTSYVVKNSGTQEDAQDIFQDGLIVFYKNVRNPKFVLSAKISTYLFAICRRLWLNRIRNNRIKLSNEDVNVMDEKLVTEFDFSLFNESTDHVSKMMKLMESIGSNCQSILRSFYFMKMSLEEIASQLDYRSEQVARQQKYRCMQRLRKMMEEELTEYRP